MKKRVLALLLTATMVLGLTACGGNDNAAADNGQTGTENAAEDSTGDSADAADATATTGEKILSVQVGPDPETIDPALNSAVDGGNM